METRTFESELAHFGVKGMRWGVRRRRESKKGVENAPVVTNRSHHGGEAPSHVNLKVRTDRKATPVEAKVVPGKPVQTRGGKHHPTADEAVKAAALKQKLHTSGKQSLTNQEMKTLIDRLQLEERLSQVAPKPKSKGRQFAEMLLKSPLPKAATGAARKRLTTAALDSAGNALPLTSKQVKISKGLDFADMLLGAIASNTGGKGKKKKK